MPIRRGVRGVNWGLAVLMVIGLTGCAGLRSTKAPATPPPSPTPPVAVASSTPGPEERRVAELEKTVSALRRELGEVRGELEALQRVVPHQAEVAELRVRLQALRRAAPELAPDPTGGPARHGTPAAPVAEATTPAPASQSSQSTGPAERGTEGTSPATLDAVPGGMEADSPAESDSGVARKTRRHRASGGASQAQELFDRGMKSFHRGDFGQAVVSFEELVRSQPAHSLAGPAQFWIGEAYFRTRDFRQATVEYRKAVKLAPQGEKIPEALFKLGLAYRNLQREEPARQAWARLLRDFPKSPAAAKARAALGTAAAVTPAALRASK